ncbi:glycosyltransferase [Alkalicoccus saliphilus]|uniref:glycosyltransferase n=1 Tax=Alkalicoccus saliphilus TaxID=200989 RepID=UPI0011B27135|nr:glycosyltransferase [Alkalicoccus saliphilus]
MKGNKLVFILGAMGQGGSERVTANLANHFASEGREVDVIMLLNNLVEYNLHENIRVIDFTFPEKPYIRRVPLWIKHLRKYHRENQPDRIISFSAKINVIVLFALFFQRNKIIVSERNDPKRDGRGPAVRLLTHLLYPFSRRVVFQTEWAQSCFYRPVRRKSVIINNPVQEISMDLPAKKKKIVNIGKLWKQKNQELLIRAFAEVEKYFPEYVLEIYGEGKERPHLEALIRSLNLEQKVFLKGWVQGVHKELAEAELFVLSSDYEGFSNALLESMMLGIPVVSSSCAGSAELIEHKKNGRLFRVGDEKELTEQLMEALGDPEQMEAMAGQAKKDVKKFSVPETINKWEEAAGN